MNEDVLVEVRIWSNDSVNVCHLRPDQLEIVHTKQYIRVMHMIEASNYEDLAGALSRGGKIWASVVMTDYFADKEICNISLHASIKEVCFRYGEYWLTLEEELNDNMEYL